MSRYCPNPACPDREHSAGIAEYRDDVETCPYCGTPLVAGVPEEDPEPPSEPASPSPVPRAHEIPVFTARDATEAEMVRGLLESADILSIVRIKSAENPAAFFSATWAPVPGQVFEVLVSSAALPTAHEILESTFGPDHPGLADAGPPRGT